MAEKSKLLYTILSFSDYSKLSFRIGEGLKSVTELQFGTYIEILDKYWLTRQARPILMHP